MLRYVLMLLAAPCFAADTFAVLPFFNHSKNATTDWIGESAAETLRESLDSEGFLTSAREDRVEVFRRLSIRPNALLTVASVIRVGNSLDAGQIIFGDFEVKAPADSKSTAGRTIRLSARAINLKRLQEGPEFEQTGALEDLSKLEAKLSWQIFSTLGPHPTSTEEEFLKLRPPVRVDAVELYIRGLIATNPDQRQRFFLHAATLDERFSQPAFQLGRISWEKKDYKTALHWLERVTRADSHYLEAQFLLGLCSYNQADYYEAIKKFQAVASELPLNEVYNNLGAAQSRKNIFGAEDNFKKALEGDEADPDYWFNLGYVEWRNGTFYAAADKFRAALARSSTDVEAKTFLGRCLAKEGPRTGDPKTEGRERLKYTFEETAFRQLQAEMKK